MTTSVPMTSHSQLTSFIVDGCGVAAHHLPILDGARNLALRSGRVTLAPGEKVGEHSTEDYEELLIILEGTATLHASGALRAEIATGQFGYIPPHTLHNVSNGGSGPLRYVYVVAKVPDA